MAILCRTLRQIFTEINPEQVKSAISTFACKDLDVEIFLKNKALDAENRNKSRTYIVIDTDLLNSGILKIEGYFTITLKAVTISDNVSKNIRKIIDGFNKDVKVIAVPLIGQFGKDINSCISGDLLLDLCLNCIYQIQDIAGARVVMLECLPIEKIIDFYKNNGFVFFQNDPFDKFNQLILVL